MNEDDIELQCGQTLVFTRQLYTPWHTFREGDEVLLVEPTGMAPHGFQDPDGPNWIAVSSNGRTVWSSIPHWLRYGTLELKS